MLLVEMCIDGTVGGSHYALEALVTRLDPAHYRPTVLFYEDNPFVERLRGRGISVLVWHDLRRWEMARVRSAVPGRRHLATLGAIARRVRLVRSLGVDLIHLNNSPELGFYEWVPAAWLARVPCITHCRGNVGSGGSRLRRWLRSGFARVIAVSDHVREDVVASGIPPDRAVRIYDGLDIAELRSKVRHSRAEVRRSLGALPEDVVLIMVGNIRRWKGQAVLVAAAGRLLPELRDRFRIWLAGSEVNPDYLQEIRELAAGAGIAQRVQYLGFRTDVPDLLSAADIAVHASTTAEPFGLVVVEAMALGIPIVAPELGGPTEILAAGGGVLYDPGDSGDLAAKLEALIRNQLGRSALAAAAADRVKAFDIGRTAREVEALYADVLHDRNSD